MGGVTQRGPIMRGADRDVLVDVSGASCAVIRRGAAD